MVAENVVLFDDVLALAYRLTPLEKIKLIKLMAAALERELALTTTTIAAQALPSNQACGDANVSCP